MTVLKSVLRGVLSSVTRSILLADDAITRFFTDLLIAGSTYFEIPDIVLTGDYNKTDDVYFTGSVIHIWGNSANDNNRGTVNADGSITWLPDGSATSVSTASGVVELNKLNAIEADRTSSTGTITVNGVGVFSGAVPTGTCTINRIGRSNTNGSTGIVANSGVSGDGISDILSPLNENFGTTTIAKNSLAVLGSDLVTDHVWPTNLGVFSVNTFTIDYNAGFASLLADPNFFPSGGSYVLTMEVVVDRGSISMLVGNGNPVLMPAGFTEIVVDPDDGSDLRLQMSSADFSGSVTFSIKQADGYGTAINISESDFFTQEPNGDYLGVDNWTNPASNIGVEWTFLGNGVYSFAGTSGDFIQLENINVGDNTAQRTRSKFTIGSFSGSGAMKLIHSSDVGAVASNDGNFVFDYTTNFSFSTMRFSRETQGDIFSCTLSNITSQILLEKA